MCECECVCVSTVAHISTSKQITYKIIMNFSRTCVHIEWSSPISQRYGQLSFSPSSIFACSFLMIALIQLNVGDFVRTGPYKFMAIIIKSDCNRRVSVSSFVSLCMCVCVMTSMAHINIEVLKWNYVMHSTQRILSFRFTQFRTFTRRFTQIRFECWDYRTRTLQI